MPQDSRPLIPQEVTESIQDLQGAVVALRSDLETVALNQAKILERFHELESAHIVLDHRQGNLESSISDLIGDLEKRGVAVANHPKELLHQFGRESGYDPELSIKPPEPK